jgi:hypothetical protein
VAQEQFFSHDDIEWEADDTDEFDMEAHWDADEESLQWSWSDPWTLSESAPAK